MILAGAFAGKKLLKVILWAVVILAILGAFLWGFNYVFQMGWKSGHSESEAYWQKESALAMEAKAKRIAGLMHQIAETQKLFKLLNDEHETQRLEESENAERAKNATVAAVLDGTFKLRDPNSRWNKAGCGGGGSGNGDTVDPSGVAGEEGGEFFYCDYGFFQRGSYPSRRHRQTIK